MRPNHLLKKRFSELILFPLFFFISANIFAQMGKDGAATVATTGVIFNRYDVLASSAAAGATSITVTNIANLSASAISGAANNPYATDALGAGDLLMIIKIQGATITTTNTSAYGAVTAYNNTGTYEIKMVQSISGNIITLSSALTNAFTVSGTQRVQVVRMPRLSGLTINSGATLTGQAWGSSYKGGIIAIEVTGNAVVNGSTTANGLGFRGGAIDINSVLPGSSNYVSTDSFHGGEKGESIAGYQTDYDALGGRYCKGGPANGGGGGTAHNGGGGGGANAGNIASWTGNGTPDNSGGAGWTAAWNLEYAGFATSSSSGGGRGGYTFSNRDRNATTVAPGDGLWNGDDRRIQGGLGGRPLTYSATSLFMGGGGGAGDQNNTLGTAGGNGGGIIYLTITGTLSGTGSINASGASASDVVGTGVTSATRGIDAAGGGGAGGAIKLNVQGTISGISLYANGGNGGKQIQYPGGITDEAEGPGGGGGGGYIAVTGTPAITMSALGGTYGTTNSSGLTEFIPNGATGASPGSAVTGLSFVGPPDIILPVLLGCFDMISLGEQKVEINWIAYNEIDLVRYELEQSTEHGEWMAIKSEPVQTGNNSTKKYTISINRSVENAQYRIKAVAKNGSFNYTCTKTLKAPALQNITAFQSNGKLYISHPNKPYTFILHNSFGQRIPVTIYRSASTTTIEKNNLPKGIYYLQIIAGEEKIVYDFLEN